MSVVVETSHGLLLFTIIFDARVYTRKTLSFTDYYNICLVVVVVFVPEAVPMHI